MVNFNLHGSHEEKSTVSIVDPEEMIEIDRVETGVMPHGSRLLNSGMKHYSVAMMSGELFEIDAMRMAVSRKILTKPTNNMKNHSMHNMSHKNMKKMDHSHMMSNSIKKDGRNGTRNGT